MFGNKFLLLELDPFEAEYYHLPQFVPYLQKEQKHLKKELDLILYDEERIKEMSTDYERLHALIGPSYPSQEVASLIWKELSS